MALKLHLLPCPAALNQLALLIKRLLYNFFHSIFSPQPHNRRRCMISYAAIRHNTNLFREGYNYVHTVLDRVSVHT